jgi:hypothetical protein
MSDGPFKTPLSNRCWQTVENRAANESFTTAQIREAVPAALAGEAKTLPSSFIRAVEALLDAPDGGSLIDPRESGQLQTLRREAAGSALAGTITDCVEDGLGPRVSLKDAIASGTAAAFGQCYEENARGIEQHAQLDQLGQAVIQLVRSRLAEAAPSAAELDAAARGLWKIGESRLARTPPKHTALEDGPDLGGDGDE